MKRYLQLNLSMLYWLLARLFRRQPLGISRVLDQMVRIGVQAVPMTGLTAFAWLIATIACHVGLNVEGGPEAVGRATTRSVVTALLAMLVANAGLTAIFFFF